MAAQLEDTKRNGELIQTLGPAGAAATGEIAFNGSFGYDNKRIILEDAEGTVSTFIFDESGAEGATGTIDGSGYVVVQINGLFNREDIATEFATAVTSVATLKITPTDDTFGQIALTQDVVGVSGNTTIQDPDSIMSLGITGFSGGAVSADGQVAGVVLYNEGILALTGSWGLHATYTDYFRTCPDCITAMDVNSDLTAEPVFPSWTLWGSQGNPTDKTCNASAGVAEGATSVTLCPSASWAIDFEGTNYVSVLTMLAHAPKGDLNHSNNPTYIKHGEVERPVVDNTKYIEKSDKEIKNIVKSVHSNYSESFEKTTYISKVGIYDEDKNLIAIAKVATPVKKTEDREYTFKIKMDF